MLLSSQECVWFFRTSESKLVSHASHFLKIQKCGRHTRLYVPQPTPTKFKNTTVSVHRAVYKAELHSRTLPLMLQNPLQTLMAPEDRKVNVEHFLISTMPRCQGFIESISQEHTHLENSATSRLRGHCAFLIWEEHAPMSAISSQTIALRHHSLFFFFLQIMQICNISSSTQKISDASFHLLFLKPFTI